MKRVRECGAGCGSVLRRGSAHTAHVVTTDGALHRTLVCPLCARRGVLMVAHLDEPTHQARPSVPRVRASRSTWFAPWHNTQPNAPLPEVGTMSREALEAELDRCTSCDEMSGAARIPWLSGMTRESLEARVSVERARLASSAGTTEAP